jgi:hypothetical protein
LLYAEVYLMASDLTEPLLEGSFVNETRVQYFDSRDTQRSDDYLNDEQLKLKFPEMVRHGTSSFTLNSSLHVAQGDLVENGDHIPQHVSGIAASSFVLMHVSGALSKFLLLTCVIGLLSGR